MDNLVYGGFVEGDDLGRGTVDVVVTEGFSGNIALKTAEGTARQISSYLREEMSRTFFARVGFYLAKEAFDSLRDKLDPRKVNGGVFLGLNGIVVKSHGDADEIGFASAVENGFDMVQNGLQQKISHDLAKYHRAGLQTEIREGATGTGGS
jgi:glycerol-3-phosphate acyltransferase PlsX